MKTGIIILNYNDYETTIKMIEQIKNYKCLDKILIVDNCSKDNSYEKIKEFENNKIELIKTEQNRGYASGNNFGIKYLINDYDILIISNPDIEIKEKDLEKLIKIIKSHKEISVIAPNVQECGKIIRGWNLPKWLDDIGLNLTYFHKYFEKKLRYKSEYYHGKLSEVEVVSGCFLIIKSCTLKEINYFDENTFLYYEENILGYKLKEKNLKTFIANDVTIKHNLSISVDKSLNSIKKYKILKKSQRYYEKAYLKSNFFKMLLLYITYFISLLLAYLNVIFIRIKKIL